MGDGMIY